VRQLLILACCLMTNPLLAAQNPPANDAAFGLQLASVEGPGYSAESAVPDSRAEWWYLSANLVDREGRLWGLEWTLYRQAPGAQAIGAREQISGRMILKHAAITTPDGDYHEQFFSGGGQLRDVSGKEPVDAGNNDWEWVSRGEALFPARLSFSIGDRNLNLLLESTGAAGAGDIDSGERNAARYYASQPRIKVRGFVDNGADNTYLRGNGRLDRAWDSPALAGNRPALDRLSLQHDAHGLDASPLIPQHAKQSSAE